MKTHNPLLSLAAVGGALLLALSAVAQAEAAPADQGSFDLTRCLETAVSQNYDIQKARERVRQQHGALIESRGRIIPNVQIGGQYQENDKALNMPGIERDSQWNVGAEVSQSLYSGGQNAATVQSRRLAEDAARFDLQAAIENIQLQTRERYYGVLLARSQIRVQEQNIELLEEELQSAKNKLDAGAVSPFNVLRAEVALANGQTPLIRARNNYRLAIEELARVLAIVPDDSRQETSLDVVGDLEFETYTANLADERETAFANRPELKSLELQRRAQERALRAARGSYQPSLTAFAGYAFQSDYLSEDRWDEVDGWNAGVRLGWNLFDGLQTRGRTVQAASALEQAHLAEQETRLAIDVEVRRANSSFIEAEELYQATRKVVEQAEESVRLARSRFDVGAATQLDVLQTQQALTEARDNQVQALHDYNVALARLRKAIGMLSSFGPQLAAAETP